MVIYKKEKRSKLITIAIFSGVVIAGYTYLCRVSGYRMVAPFASDDGTIFFKTIGGKILKAELSK